MLDDSENITRGGQAYKNLPKLFKKPNNCLQGKKKQQQKNKTKQNKRD